MSSQTANFVIHDLKERLVLIQENLALRTQAGLYQASIAKKDSTYTELRIISEKNKQKIKTKNWTIISSASLNIGLIALLVLL